MTSITNKIRVAVLISGRGSNMVSLVNASHEDEYPAEIVCVISDNAKAKGLETAKDFGIHSTAITRSDFSSKSDHEKAILDELAKHKPDLICLAGFMRVLSADFVAHFEDRILNTHPSLLPKYKGLDTHARAIEAGDKSHGCSVHFVTAGLDEGPVIAQTQLKIKPEDDEETLANRVLVLEHELYPSALKTIANEISAGMKD